MSECSIRRLQKTKHEKYERDSFKLGECDAEIQLIPEGLETPDYATAFLNIRLPDGRWIAFKVSEGLRVPIYKPKVEERMAKRKTA